MGDITYEKNMKQFLCILTTCLLLAVTCIPAFAQDSMQHIQYYDDGSYTIETLTIDNPSISLYSSTKKGRRSKIYYSSDNQEAIGARIANYMDVSYAYRDLEDLPEGYTVPEGREKPWAPAMQSLQPGILLMPRLQ